MRTRHVLATVATVVLLAGCNGDGGTPDDDASDDQAGGAEVEIVDNAFEPAAVSVAVGDTVHWTNTGDVAHTVTFDAGPDSGQLASGDEFEHAFDEAGEFSYVCSIHPAMEGTVTVTG